MAYQGIFDLTADPVFNGRCQSASLEQAQIFKDDARGDFVALANAIMRGESEKLAVLTRMDAAGPGIADKAATPDGIDQSLVTDADLLSLTQANWPTVAALYYDAEGNPTGGTP